MHRQALLGCGVAVARNSLKTLDKVDFGAAAGGNGKRQPVQRLRDELDIVVRRRKTSLNLWTRNVRGLNVPVDENGLTSALAGSSFTSPWAAEGKTR